MRTSLALAGLMLLSLAGCAPQVERGPLTLPNQPSDFPSELYRAAAQRGQPVYRLDASRSIAVIRVYRGGRMAKLGHDHVVASHQVQGLILWQSDWRARRADLFVPLAALTVDEAELRRQYSLTTQPSERDIEGTRNNMLNKTLRVNDNPFVTLQLQPLSGALPQMSVQVEISLNGVTRRKQVEVKVEELQGALGFSGAFKLKQTEFGLEPYSLLGGLLRVEDEVDIDFDLTAVRL
ncbi:YceI family protein [Marinobacterium zhoushanense]|uniref:YceI family protein n=1 Tax=Marinobacterium zhoushanense TaxID=1679163 RepID=UPI00166821C8|nr:YceI family protein [Marinobacterium zhoushanense]